MLPVQNLAIPPLPSLVTPPSLSLHCASLVLVGCCITSSLVVPPSLLHRLFVELPPLSPHCRLSLSRISCFALLPQRRRCRPTQFATTGLPPPSSRQRLQFEPMDPPPPPGHIRVVDVNVINDNIIQPPHDHCELPHHAVQSVVGITDLCDCCVCSVVVSSPLPHPVVAISPTASTIVIVGVIVVVAVVGIVIRDAIIDLPVVEVERMRDEGG